MFLLVKHKLKISSKHHSLNLENVVALLGRMRPPKIESFFELFFFCYIYIYIYLMNGPGYAE